MTTKQLAILEKQINTHLAATPADKRPESEIRGQRIQSLAYSVTGFYEATTTNGHSEYITTDRAKTFLPNE